MKFILTDLLASWARSLPLKTSNIGPVIVQESYDTSSFSFPISRETFPSPAGNGTFPEHTLVPPVHLSLVTSIPLGMPCQ